MRLRRIAVVIITVLAVGLIPSTAEASAHQGTWRGTTAQSRGISLRVNGYEQIAYLAVRIEVQGFSCSAVITWTFKGAAKIRADGTFTVHGHSGIDSLTVNGRFLNRFKAEGFAKSTVFDPCFGSGRTSWTASKVLT